VEKETGKQGQTPDAARFDGSIDGVRQHEGPTISKKKKRREAMRDQMMAGSGLFLSAGSPKRLVSLFMDKAKHLL